MCKQIVLLILLIQGFIYCEASHNSLNQANKLANIAELEAIVQNSQGPSEVIAITNGGDGAIVEKRFRELAPLLFRADGNTSIFVHEETERRGQFLGLLDALRDIKNSSNALNPKSVSLGIMIPGKGTRMSPITQRLHGIKPFMEMLVRPPLSTLGEFGPWLSGADASIYSWTLVAHHLKRMGFCGIAWKWGDEPQIAATRLSDIHLDLSETDAVRFASELEITDDLAKNKEWFVRDPKTGSMIQIHRRDKSELIDVLHSVGANLSEDHPKGLAHIGSPAFSYIFLEEAEKIFGKYTANWMDVDGYLFETLTQPKELWEADLARDQAKSEEISQRNNELYPKVKATYIGLAEVVHLFPNFYDDVMQLKKNIETRRGHAFQFEVIDFGSELYWADIGQLQKARKAMHEVQEDTDSGVIARALAGIAQVKKDQFGNRIVGQSHVPKDGSVRNSVLIDTKIYGTAHIDGAVLVNSELGEATIQKGSVVFNSTVQALNMGRNGFSYMSVADTLTIPDTFLHTSIPANPLDLSKGLQDWWAIADGKYNPGGGTNYFNLAEFVLNGRTIQNPKSFNAKYLEMRQRTVQPATIEDNIDRLFREPVRKKLKV